MTHPTMRAPGIDAIPALRSILFVPGDRPERYEKALAAGADAVCIDLEDAVAPECKGEARDAAARFLTERRAAPTQHQRPESSTAAPVIVRVNDRNSREGERDAAALAGCPPPDGFMIPKVRTAADVQGAARQLPKAALLPLIETAQGLEHAGDITVASANVAALVFGGFDLAIELGAEPVWEALLHARSRVVHAAALGGVPAVDMPSRDLSEVSGLREEATRARRLGFGGKVAIHPAQIPVIHEVFTPSADEVRRARGILQADRAAGGSAVALAGRMVDRPVVEAARRILQRARSSLPVPDQAPEPLEPSEPPPPPTPADGLNR